VPGNQGRKSFLWSGLWEAVVQDDFGIYYQGVTRSAGRMAPESALKGQREKFLEFDQGQGFREEFRQPL